MPLLLCAPMAGGNGNGQLDDFCWETLVAQLLHPVQVGIIEALRWIDQPLSATDLQRVSRGERIDYHVRRLANLNVLSAQDSAETGSGPARAYRLVRRSSR